MLNAINIFEIFLKYFWNIFEITVKVYVRLMLRWVKMLSKLNVEGDIMKWMIVNKLVNSIKLMANKTLNVI